MRISKAAVIVILVASFLGFLDATFLAVEHFRGVIPPCGLTNGCELVTTSKYAVVFGIPVALVGAIYYGIIFFLTIFYVDTKRNSAMRSVTYIVWIGFLASLGFIYLQLFVIHSICPYCMFSALTSTTLFVTGFFLRPKPEQAQFPQ